MKRHSSWFCAGSTLFSLILVHALAACASTPATGPAAPPAHAATTTAADVAPSSERLAEPAAAAPNPVADEAPATAPAPPGRLVCRTIDPTDGTTELYLEWSGDEAHGVLRRVAQSGMVHEDRVNAERAGGLIVVDDPGETDLVTHAALVQQINGALQMRLSRGISGAWSRCQ